MAGNYRGTSVEFTYETLEEFRKEVLASQHLGETGFGETNLRTLAKRYAEICTRLEKATWKYGAAHQGPDSTAAQDRLKELVRLGNEGVEKLWTMAGAVSNQTPAFKQMYDQLEPLTTMEHGVWDGFSEPVGPVGMAATAIPVVGPVASYGEAAVDAGVGMWERYQAESLASEYQATSNQSLETSIPVFDPAPAQQFDTQQGPALTTTGAGGGLSTPIAGASNPGLAPASAAVPPAAAGIPGGTGAVGAGAGGIAPGAAGTVTPGQQVAPIAPLSPAADLGRRTGQGNSSATPGVPGLSGRSNYGTGTSPGASARPFDVDTSRGLPAGGVIRPEMPRSGVPAPEPAPRPRPTGTIGPETEARSGVPRAGSPPSAHQPMMPAAGMGGAGRGGSSRRRPDWLIEPDPDSYWLADVPPHLPGVLRPTADIDDFDDR